MLRTHRAGTGSPRRRLICAAVVVPLGVASLAVQALASAPEALGDTSHCLIINNAIDTSYISLQGAVTAAGAGTTLWVRGTCTGTTVISQDLTITGQQRHGFTEPTLNGNQSGPVLTVGSGATVTINNLTVTGGFAGSCCGAGIDSKGTLTLNNDDITGNNTAAVVGGGGIGNVGGSLTLNSTRVTDNAAPGGGGGIWSSGTLILNGRSIITGNSALQGGGIGAFSGTVTLNDTTRIRENTVGPSGGYPNGYVAGGGAFAANIVLTMTGNATITENTSSNVGGGIGYANSTLTGATAGTGGNVHGNAPDDIGPY